MKILYNVTTCVDHSSQAEWVNWMIENHIPDVMKTGMFASYSIQRVIGGENETGVTFAVQFVAPSPADFDRYQAEFAPKLQEEHKEKFGEKALSFRTLMEIVDHS